jgi:hypothetical protein
MDVMSVHRVSQVNDVRSCQGNHPVVIVPVQLKDFPAVEPMNFVNVLHGQVPAEQDDCFVFMMLVPVIAAMNPGFLDKLAIDFHDDGNIDMKIACTVIAR